MLTLSFSSKTQVRLNALVTSAKVYSAKIQHIQDQLEHLSQGLSIESLTPNAQNQLRLLLGLSERACDVIAQHRILESLAFAGMYGRYEDVDEAHFETLRWIYGDNLYTDKEDERSANDETYKDKDNADDEAGDIKEDEYEDEEKTSARELLLNWILSGAGIFHISGKLGSGKSTLMKYLSDHNCTGELLGKWAGSSLR
jgi:type II secretory pathway predicted ATPase ExeA